MSKFLDKISLGLLLTGLIYIFTFGMLIVLLYTVYGLFGFFLAFIFISLLILKDVYRKRDIKELEQRFTSGEITKDEYENLRNEYNDAYFNTFGGLINLRKLLISFIVIKHCLYSITLRPE